ncbi:Hypothetical predicted protein [Cloeon dipterum]|nr:Hypothetical predicted protein [Cloeon dipterum]
MEVGCYNLCRTATSEHERKVSWGPQPTAPVPLFSQVGRKLQLNRGVTDVSVGQHEFRLSRIFQLQRNKTLFGFQLVFKRAYLQMLY